MRRSHLLRRPGSQYGRAPLNRRHQRQTILPSSFAGFNSSALGRGAGSGRGYFHPGKGNPAPARRSEEHTSELQSQVHLVCRLLLEEVAERFGTISGFPFKSGANNTLFVSVTSGDNLHNIRLKVFFFKDTATTEIYPLSLHDALPISAAPCPVHVKQAMIEWWGPVINEYYG